MQRRGKMQTAKIAAYAEGMKAKNGKKEIPSAELATFIIQKNPLSGNTHEKDTSAGAEKSILLVDTDAERIASYAILLNDCGFHVSAFTSVFEAMNSFVENPPDLIITDINIPIFTGNFLDDLHNNHKEAVPVIALAEKSAFAGKHFFAILRRPVQPFTLLNQVRSCFSSASNSSS